MAEAAGFHNNVTVLKQPQTKEMAMGDWLGEHLPGFVTRFLQSSN